MGPRGRGPKTSRGGNAKISRGYCARDEKCSQGAGRRGLPREVHQHLRTVHHKDGNHHNNPQDGSNWENLCVYCHEDVHSREVLSEHLAEGKSGRETSLVYGGTPSADPDAS